jgi:hypothetical protein
VASLARGEGYFFEINNGVFTVIFLTPWSIDEGATRDGEFFYNVYTSDAEAVLGRDLSTLLEQLAEHNLSSPHEEFDSTFSMELPEQTVDNSVEVVEHFVTRWRDDERITADLDEIAVFLESVGGAESKLRGISTVRRDEGHFNTVVGDRDSTRLAEPVKQVRQVEQSEWELESLIDTSTRADSEIPEESEDTPRAEQLPHSQHKGERSDRIEAPDDLDSAGRDDSGDGGEATNEKEVESEPVESNVVTFSTIDRRLLGLILLTNLLTLLLVLFLVYRLYTNGTIRVRIPIP